VSENKINSCRLLLTLINNPGPMVVRVVFH
jgi:hypothetical protein